MQRVRRYLEDDDLFCVTYGDGLADIDIDALVAFHRSHGRLGTVTGVYPPSRFGQLVNDGPRVAVFSEKPAREGTRISGGFFVFSRAFLDRLPDRADLILEREPLEQPGPRRRADGLRARRLLAVRRHRARRRRAAGPVDGGHGAVGARPRRDAAGGVMLAYGVCIGSRERYETLAAPALRDLGGVVIEADDQRSICSAYNAILDAVAGEPDIEGLVLLHEDVTIESAAFIAAIRTELADPDVAVVGAIGALRPASLRWWQGEGRGRVRDSSGLVDFGGGRHDVDVLDGLCLVLSPLGDRAPALRRVGVRRLPRLRLRHLPPGARRRPPRARRGAADHAPHARRLRRRRRLRPRQRRLRGQVARPAVRAPGRPRARAGPCRACGGPVATVPADPRRRGGRLRPLRQRPDPARRRRPRRARDRRPRDGRAPCPRRLDRARRHRSAWRSSAATPRWPRSWPDRGIEIVAADADVAAVVGAFERAVDAAEVATRARAALAPGGLLLAECRNFAASEAAVDPIVWGRPDLADLRTLLTPAGARALLERASFTAVETAVGTSEAYDPPELWSARRDHWASMRLGADSENVLLVTARAA